MTADPKHDAYMAMCCLDFMVKTVFFFMLLFN